MDACPVVTDTYKANVADAKVLTGRLEDMI